MLEKANFTVDVESENYSGGVNNNLVGNKFLDINSIEDAKEHAEKVIATTGLDEYRDLITKGAILSSFPGFKADSYEGVELEDLEAIAADDAKTWSQPWQLYILTAVSALSGTVQGLDETAIGGAQIFFPKYFGIDGNSSHDASILGIVNSVPYLSATFIGCPLSVVFNHYLGRRGTIFWANLVAGITGLWQAFSPSYQVLLAGRLIMGITLGMKSSTAPVFSAESTPTKIRGSLVTLWQAFVAFGVLLGSIMGIAFLDVKPSTNWRFMLGSIFPLPIFICAVTYCVPESPRWLIKKGRNKQAFEAFRKLRTNDLVAARDFYYAYSLIEVENSLVQDKKWYNQFIDLFTVPRNRSAALGSSIVMFGLQFCGVNVLTFYISTILTDSGFSARASLSGSCGFGAMAVVGALTASVFIEKKGRRFLLLLTYPLLSAFLFWTGFSFYAHGEKERLGLVLTGIYVYVFFFGLGAGPVCWTYTSESASLQVRDAHSSLGSGITWLFSFVLGFTLPNMRRAIENVGVFCFHGTWCLILTVLIFLFVPETQGYTLEELDAIFNVPIWEHSKYQIRRLKNITTRLIGRNAAKGESFIEFALKY